MLTNRLEPTSPWCLTGYVTTLPAGSKYQKCRRGRFFYGLFTYDPRLLIQVLRQERVIARIPITPRISLDERELVEGFLRASGAGGQNIQKVETAVQLRFDVRHSPSLPEDVRERLERLAGRRLTREGVLVITAQRHRMRERNREDAMERLCELIRAAAAPPPPVRRPTKPSRAAKARRVDEKTRRGSTKRLRGRPEEGG